MENLPDAVLEHISSYLWVSERSRWLGACRDLWKLKQEVETKDEAVVLHRDKQRKEFNQPIQDSLLVTSVPNKGNSTTTVFPLLIHKNWNHNLKHLDLGSHATDLFWKSVSEHGLFRQLTHVSMVGSHFLTNQGLRWLSQHAHCEETVAGPTSITTIESIDITYCQKTTYEGTFQLRDSFRNSLKILRRQPAWLDGHFHTPFGGENDDNGTNNNRNNSVEIHTYYPDGSFSFTRQGQSRGYVHELEPLNDEETYLRDKLQYVNFEPPPGWPTWTLYSYRPGVCLLRLPEGAQDASSNNNNPQLLQAEPHVRNVLVGQSLRKLRPPVKELYQLMKEQADSIAVGTSVFFNAQRERLDARPANGRGCMISKMKVYPLEQPLPPDNLVTECRTTCEALRVLGHDVIDSGELFLNQALQAEDNEEE